VSNTGTNRPRNVGDKRRACGRRTKLRIVFIANHAVILSGPSANIRLLWVRFSSPTQRNVYNGPASASATGRLSIIVSVQAITSELNKSPCSAFYGGCKRDTARICCCGAVAAERRTCSNRSYVSRLRGQVYDQTRPKRSVGLVWSGPSSGI